MNRQFVREVLGWGFTLWLIGYVLGFVFFFILPAPIIGWVIMPIGILLTIWVLLKKIKKNSLRYYLILSIIWTLIAAALDYLFIVKTLKPVDGYYKLDVYFYYFSTFALPLIVGWRKK